VEPSIQIAYRSESAVVVVKIVSTTPGGSPTGTLIRAEVLDAWKRQISVTININTDTDCAYPVKSGEDYLLFLAQDHSHHYSTERCFGNLEKATSANAVKWLREHDRQ